MSEAERIKLDTSPVPSVTPEIEEGAEEAAIKAALAKQEQKAIADQKKAKKAAIAALREKQAASGDDKQTHMENKLKFLQVSVVFSSRVGFSSSLNWIFKIAKT